jgi:periplasmic copper chaperone A
MLDARAPSGVSVEPDIGRLSLVARFASAYWTQKPEEIAVMRAVFATLFALLLVSGCAPAPKAAHVDAAWVRLPAVSGNPGAAYFILVGGPVADRLMAVSSPLAVRAEMHDMAPSTGSGQGMKGGMMSMAPLDAGLDVPAGATVTFAPGGKHVMLFDISPKAATGGKLPLMLSFASGATTNAEAAIVAAGDEAPPAKK